MGVAGTQSAFWPLNRPATARRARSIRIWHTRRDPLQHAVTLMSARHGDDARLCDILSIMTSRRLSPIDRLLSGIDSALRTVAGTPARGARPYPAANIADSQMDARERRHATGLMRINHAGEVAAQALYQGHAVVARDPDIASHLRQAAREERDHLLWCEARLAELGGRTSRLAPLWFGGAWLIGAASGALGDRWALGLVEETERQVARHLEDHLGRLPAADRRSRAILSRMRDEEIEHGAAAARKGAARLPMPVQCLMRASAAVMTRTAYWL